MVEKQKKTVIRVPEGKANALFHYLANAGINVNDFDVKKGKMQKQPCYRIECKCSEAELATIKRVAETQNAEIKVTD